MTLTLPEEMLKQIELEAERLGRDRLSLMREIIASHLQITPTKKKRSEKK